MANLRLIGFISGALLIVLPQGVSASHPVSSDREPTLSCAFIPLGSAQSPDVDLGGRFRFNAHQIPSESGTLTSTLLVLDRDGAILRSLPIDSGDEVQVALRDNVQIKL